MQIKIVSAAVQGKAHIETGTPCQDSVDFRKYHHGGVIALADGAGSRLLSQIGARLACDSICRLCEQEFDSLYLAEDEKCQKIIVKQIQEDLSLSGYELDEISCTLLFVAWQDGKVLSGHIGDGMIFLVDDLKMEVFSYPENGGAANQTYFITETNASDHLRIQKCEINDGTFLMCSDGGMASLYQEVEKKPALAIAKLTRWLHHEEETKVNEALRENIETLFKLKTNDDISVIMMRIESMEGDGYENL